MYEVQHYENSNLGIPCKHTTTATCARNENLENYVAFWLQAS